MDLNNSVIGIESIYLFKEIYNIGTIKINRRINNYDDKIEDTNLELKIKDYTKFILK